MQSPPAYGQSRERGANVSYAEVERAAITILKSERRPTVENLREALGRGSPDTIGNALKRFWRDLGIRIDGDPAALSRMPPDIADLADGMWQKALKLAGEAATQSDNGARERLAQIQMEAELRAHSLDLREREYDSAARAREKALADSREHLLLLMKSLAREQATVRAQEARIADLEAQLGQYQQQLAALIASAVVRHRATRKPLPARAKPRRTAKTAPNRAFVTNRKPSRQAPPKSLRLKPVNKAKRRGRR